MAELKPKTLARALDILKNEAVTVVGGGTDLMVRNHTWAGLPAGLQNPPLFTGRIAELRALTEADGRLLVGGAVTLAELLACPGAPDCLRQALHGMAAPGIRNVGTLAGNICNASPAGDTLPVLYALGAAVTLQSADGVREMPVESFITGPGRKELSRAELLTQVSIPLQPYDVAFYHKIGPRKAQAISKLTFVGLARLSGGVVTDFRAAFGAVAPTVVRCSELEQKLVGVKAAELDAPFAETVIAQYAPFIRPINDQRSTAAYRKQAALGLLGRFLKQIAEKAEEQI